MQERVVDYRERIKELEEKLAVTVEALKSIKKVNHDDKTPARYIKSLRNWEDKVCNTSWYALKDIGIDPLSRK